MFNQKVSHSIGTVTNKFQQLQKIGIDNYIYVYRELFLDLVKTFYNIIPSLDEEV